MSQVIVRGLEVDIVSVELWMGIGAQYQKQKKEIINLCYKGTYSHNCKTIEFRMIHIFPSHIQDLNPIQKP